MIDDYVQVFPGKAVRHDNSFIRFKNFLFLEDEKRRFHTFDGHCASTSGTSRYDTKLFSKCAENSESALNSNTRISILAVATGHVPLY